MKKHLAVNRKWFCALLFIPLLCMAQVKKEWVSTYNAIGNSSYDNAAGIMVSASGNVYITSSAGNGKNGSDITTIKYDKHANRIWTKKYNGELKAGDGASAIWLDNEENVYVAGFSEAQNSIDLVVISYDSAGNTKWINRENPFGTYNYPITIMKSASGNLYVTGYGFKTAGDPGKIVTIKYNSAGEKQWAAIYEAPNNADAYSKALTVDSNDNVYVTGGVVSGKSNDYLTIKYNSFGEPAWVKTYDGPAERFDEANAVQVDADMNVYVTGTSRNDQAMNFATIKYNSDGVVQWARQFNNYEGPLGILDFEAKKLLLDKAGNIYVAFESLGFTLIKYNPAGSEQWSAQYAGGGYGEDKLKGMAMDSMNNIYLTGAIGIDPELKFATAKFDNLGQFKWAATYKGPGFPARDRSLDIPAGIGVDAKGNVYVTGTTDDPQNKQDVLTIKYNKDGEEKWQKRVNGRNSGDEMANAMVVDKMGNVYVTGTTSANNPAGDYVTVKYDRNGDKQWARRVAYKGAEGWARAMTLDEWGNVIVTGVSTLNRQADFLTVKYNPEGALLWTMRYNGPGNTYDQAASVTTDAAGNIYVAGRSGNEFGSSLTTIKYLPNGLMQWVVNYQQGMSSDPSPSQIKTDKAGNVYITGMIAIGSSFDYLTIKYNTQGQLLWANTYNGPQSQFDKAEKLFIDDQQNVYVTGWSSGYATIKYNASGQQLWVARGFDGPSNLANDIVTDRSGNVFVTGTIDPYTQPRFATIKYNAAGMQLWMMIYDAAASGNAMSQNIAMDTDDNIYVNGSEKSASGRNFVTLKYDNNGALKWIEKRAYNGNITESYFAMDGGNNLYVTGTATVPGRAYDFFTIKYSQAKPSSIQEQITRATGIDAPGKEANKLKVMVSPNPFAQSFTLKWNGNEQTVTISVSDVNGKIIEQKNGQGATGQLTTGIQWPAGVYYISIVQGEERTVLKLVKL